ncbi:putative membrane protein [Novosphingobium sp. PhB57]|jgi:uncharacterized membrane protein|uniref:DUF1700 domain-containing protein n=1 Tax=unclassified Novosphingobium TaxID=2644732 RepID=UPI001050B79B|nr:MULTISPECIES: DUF1700 domain-containing protein [unclassified Novosphingobium]TCU59336.1 putative membrane protein [Novosphingobium sp. PhB57]TDW64011.1 putative membrane protein [Novosphingobium sp. PhB55]
MTRNEFIRRLKAGLKGMPQGDVAEIAADYEEHFEAGAAEGRSEQEVAAALGDPGRLARELRFEAGFRNWESGRSPSSAWGAILAFMGLATIDILILLPIVLPVLGVMFGLYVAAIAVFVAGGFMLIAGPFSGFPGGILVAILGGLGTMSAAVAIAALLTLVSIWIINALMWFGRLHYRVIEPAIHPEN